MANKDENNSQFNSSEKDATEKEHSIHMYRQMLKIRKFEENVNQLYTSAKMPGLSHLSIGQEAVAVGVCEALRIDDYITSTHRGHGHCLAKGAATNLMFAELLGKASGYCRGKGGSMHIADQDSGNLGANAIVGGSAGIATGAALSAKMRGTDQVSVCFFGDGATDQGVFHESLNFAALKKLPILFVVEDNNYAVLTKKEDRRNWSAKSIAKAFKINAYDIKDEPKQIYKVLAKNIFKEPLLINVHTNRIYWHAGAGRDNYKVFDRLESEIKILGPQGRIIDQQIKKKIKKLWVKHLKKL